MEFALYGPFNVVSEPHQECVVLGSLVPLTGASLCAEVDGVIATERDP